MIITVRGIVFDVDAEFDRDGRIENLRICLAQDRDEFDLIEVLSDKVVIEIEQKVYAQYEGPEVNEDGGEDR